MSHWKNVCIEQSEPRARAISICYLISAVRCEVFGGGLVRSHLLYMALMAAIRNTPFVKSVISTCHASNQAFAGNKSHRAPHSRQANRIVPESGRSSIVK